jgi:hypothetical protein
MGVEIPNVLTGNTNGTIVTVDYTADFQLLTSAIGSVTTELQAINFNLIALNVALEKNIGATSVTPAGLGTLGYSLMQINKTLSAISLSHAEIPNLQVDTQQCLSDITTALQHASLSINRLESLHSMAVADQLKNNRFQQQETVAALERNNIAPQPMPSMKQVVEDNVKDSTTIHTSASVTAQVNQVTSNLFAGLENYIANSWLVTQVEGFFKKIASNIGLKRLTRNVAAPVQSVNAKEVQAKAAATLNTPIVIPEYPVPVVPDPE